MGQEDYERFHGMGAHHYSWVMHYGPIPPQQLVYHIGPRETKRCVRPEHLRLGTVRKMANDRRILQWRRVGWR
jgi:hypothetical protein